MSTAPFVEQSAMVSERGKGRNRGRDRDFRGRGSFGGGRDPMVAGKVALIQGPTM